MIEVISETKPSTSGLGVAAFVALSLGLTVVGLGFAYGVIAGVSQTLLGVVLSAGFAILAAMLVLYSRLSTPHRIVLEYDEDLW